MLLVALLVFFASILVPVLKLLALALLLVSINGAGPRTAGPDQLYRMVGDRALVDGRRVHDRDPGGLGGPGQPRDDHRRGGAIAFCAVVIVTIFASMSFDPRLMWDGPDEREASRSASRPPGGRREAARDLDRLDRPARRRRDRRVPGLPGLHREAPRSRSASTPPRGWRPARPRCATWTSRSAPCRRWRSAPISATSWSPRRWCRAPASTCARDPVLDRQAQGRRAASRA